MKKHLLLLACTCLLPLTGCRLASAASAETETSIPITEYEVHIPDLSREYRFVVVNDVHIIEVEDTVKEEKRSDANERHEFFKTEDAGQYSSQLWQDMVLQINALNPDGVILNGDMIDFFSTANLESFQNGLDKLSAPVLYNRADHDLGIWYHDNITKEQRDQLEAQVDENAGAMYWEYEDFVIAGINDSTSQLSEDGLDILKQIWELHKPVILATHVPLKSLVDDGLSEESKRVWNDRALLWGTDGYYEPDATTQEYLDMVLADDSPVAAVFSAHLHFPYEDKLNEKITQYTLDASFKGKMALVTIQQ